MRAISADYFQIYLRDEAHPDLPEDYTDETITRRITAGPYAIILHTVRNFTVSDAPFKGEKDYSTLHAEPPCRICNKHTLRNNGMGNSQRKAKELIGEVVDSSNS